MTSRTEVPTDRPQMRVCASCPRILPPAVLTDSDHEATLCGECAGRELDRLAGREAAPARKPFDRAEHCRRIGAAGGRTTAERHGSHHMRAIGKAGAQVTIERHGVAYFNGLVKARGWKGRRYAQLNLDLALARVR